MESMPNLTNKRRLNQILMDVYKHVKKLGFDNGYLNQSFSYHLYIPNIVPLNEILRENIISYLKDNPNEGLQEFVDSITDDDYIEQVLHDLALILVEYDHDDDLQLMPDEPVLEQIQDMLRRKIEPSEYSMTYKNMDITAVDYFTLMYDMLLNTIDEYQQNQQDLKAKGVKKRKKGKKRSSKRSKKGRRKNRKTRSSRKI